MEICNKAGVKALGPGWTIPSKLNGVLNRLKLRDEFFKLADSESTKGNEPLAHCIALLGHLAGMSLKTGDSNAPYAPLARFGNGSRTPLPEDFEQHHLDVLERLLTQTINPILTARICDLLWLRKKPRNVDWARKAIEAFCVLSEGILASDVQSLIGCVSDLSRAVQIWKHIGSPSDIQTRIEDTIEKIMELGQPEPGNGLRVQFFKLLPSLGKTSRYSRWVSLGEELADTSVAQKNHEKAREYWEIVEKLHLLDKNQPEARQCRFNAMELYAVEAREHRKEAAHSMLLQSKYEKAIEAFRTMGGPKKEIENLHRELLEIQKDIPKEMKMIEMPIDLTEAVKVLKDELGKRSFSQAVMIVCSMAEPPSKVELIEVAKADIARFPLQSLVAKTIVDEKGKAVGRTSSGGLDFEDEEAARERASANLQLSIGLKSTLIEIGRVELIERQDAGSEFFEDLVELNPFVPEARKQQILAGLMAGFNGNWIECGHILLPQLENSLRTIMDLAGVTISSIDSESIQKEKDLNAFIYSSEMKTLLGEDMQFLLQVVLTDKTGFNLRNKAAHGLLTDSLFRSGSPIGFVWAVTVLLCNHYKAAFYSKISEPPGQ